MTPDVETLTNRLLSRHLAEGRIDLVEEDLAWMGRFLETEHEVSIAARTVLDTALNEVARLPEGMTAREIAEAVCERLGVFQPGSEIQDRLVGMEKSHADQ